MLIPFPQQRRAGADPCTWHCISCYISQSHGRDRHSRCLWFQRRSTAYISSTYITSSRQRSISCLRPRSFTVRVLRLHIRHLNLSRRIRSFQSCATRSANTKYHGPRRHRRRCACSIPHHDNVGIRSFSQGHQDSRHHQREQANGDRGYTGSTSIRHANGGQTHILFTLATRANQK